MQGVNTSGVPTFNCDGVNLSLRIGHMTAGSSNSSIRRIGLADQALTAAPNNGIYWKITGTTGNYYACCNSGGSSETGTDSGIAASDSTFADLLIKVVGGTAYFYIAGALVATISTNVPTAALRMRMGSTAHSSFTGGHEIDFVEIIQQRTY
jgi:hypothetical protein